MLGSNLILMMLPTRGRTCGNRSHEGIADKRRLEALEIVDHQEHAAGLRGPRFQWTGGALGSSVNVRSGPANLNTAISEDAAPMGEDRARHDRSRGHEQETAPQPLGSIQGQGSAGRRQGDKTVAEFAQQYEVHPTQVSD